MLDGMVERTHGTQTGQHPEFGDEVLQIVGGRLRRRKSSASTLA